MNLYEVVFLGTQGQTNDDSDTLFLVRAKDFQSALDEACLNGKPDMLPVVVFEIGHDLTKYPEDAQLTPQAYFMKGMSFKNTNRTEASRTWKALITKYPRSDAAAQAREQLRAMGVSTTTAATPPPKRKPTTH